MENDNFEAATAAARRCACDLIEQDIPPVIIADALLTQGLAVWSAENGRHQSANTVRNIWAAVKGAR